MIITVFATVGIITAALLGLRQLVEPYKEKADLFMSWFEDFKRDWSGEEESPGRDRVPGVMERLNRLDGELSSNGGSSTKDVVNKMYDNQGVLMEAFVEMGERLISIEEHLSVSKSKEPL
jgi:hypothetical protein